MIGLADARRMATRVMLDVAEGKDPASERKAKRNTGSFTELAADYVKLHSRKHNKSWRQAEKLVARHLLPRWGKMKAASVTRADVRAMMIRIEAPIVAAGWSDWKSAPQPRLPTATYAEFNSTGPGANPKAREPY